MPPIYLGLMGHLTITMKTLTLAAETLAQQGQV